MNIWTQHFTSATFGNPWGSGLYENNELAPEDLIAHLCKMTLVNQAKLAAIFGGAAENGGRIEYMDGISPYDLRPMPRLQIHLGQAPEDREATKSNLITVNVQIGVRYDIKELFPVAYGQASIASVVHFIKKALRANDQLIINTSSTPSGINMAERSKAGGIDFLPDVEQQDGRILAARRLSWIYYIRVNEDTERIWNLL